MARLIALLLVASTAYAQSDDRAAQAKIHYETGMAHFQLEEYDKSIVEWENGFRIKPVPQFLYNIAQAYRLSKQYEKAQSFYKKYLNMDPKAPNKAEVERHLLALGKLIDQQKATSNAPPTQPIATDTGKPAPKVIEPPKPKPEPARPAVATVAKPPEPAKPIARPEPVKPAPEPARPVVQPEPAHADASLTAKPKDDRPITKKGWFWGVMGGVGAVVIAGVVVGVVLGTQSSGDGTMVLAPARF
jgi:iron complex outermembrane recepter protein